MKPRMVMLLCIGSALLSICLVLVIPMMLGKQKARQKFAVVDLTQVITKQQERAVRVLADINADEASKKKAIESAGEFGKRVNGELVQLSQQCGCVLLMREAIIAGEMEDLTPALLTRVNGLTERKLDVSSN